MPKVPCRVTAWASVLVLAVMTGGAAISSVVTASSTTVVVAKPTVVDRSIPVPVAPISPYVGGIPTLGQLAGTFFDGEGFGQVRPTTVFNGGDPTGNVTDVAWSSWGGPTAMGSGMNDWVGPNQSVADGTEEPVTIEAFDRETCEGKPMYGAVEWYFPQHGEHFDPRNYEDICTGQYVDLGCLTYVQATMLLQSGPLTRGHVATGVTCDGSSWANALIITNYFNPTNEGIPLGAATFQRERGRRWVVAATFIHRDISTLDGPPVAYCRALARRGAPADLRCPTEPTTIPVPAMFRS